MSFCVTLKLFFFFVKCPLVRSWQTRKGSASKRKNRRENEERRRRGRTKHGKKKREVEEEETSRKRTCQSSGSSDGVVLGHGSKRKMEDADGDDQMQMETEEIAEVEVQRWMNVMLVEEEQNELKDCESTVVEERELDPEKVKDARLEEVQFMQKKTIVGRGAVAKRWMPSKPEMGGRRERRWIDKEQAGCQRFQRFGSAPGRLLRSYTTIGSCKGRIDFGSHVEQQWSSEESHDDRCQESTLESAWQGGRLHRVTTRSRGRAGSVWQAQLLVVRIPQGGVGVGRLPC